MRLLVALIALAACGDNLPFEELEEARSGTRLKLEWHLYEDGTQQLAPDAFYDAHLHARCTPAPWSDATIRCVPEGGDTVFTDAACTSELGRAHGRAPRFFVGRDLIAGAAIAARVYRAGSRLETPPAARFERRDGACTAAASEPDGATYYALGAAIDGAGLVEVVHTDLGDAPLGLRLRTTVDGLRAPLGFIDRALGVACRPEDRAGGAACVPVDAVAATAFADADCEEPAVIVDIAAEPTASAPAYAFTGVDGCAAYHAVGAELTAIPFQRVGEACVRMPATMRAFGLGAPLALPAIARTIEDTPTGRLRRIVLTAGELRGYDPRLFDTATRAECERHPFAYGSRCLPAHAPSALRLFANDRCGHEVAIAEVARTPCAPVAFAIARGEGDATVHAIGAPYTGPLFAQDGAGACIAHTTPADRVPHALGPALPPDVFVAAIPFSER